MSLESLEASVKPEPEWDSGSEALEALYANHVVKEELVLGPEVLQPRDAFFALQESARKEEETYPEDSPSTARLQKISSEKPTNSSGRTNLMIGGTNFKCNTCSKGFSVKTDLEKHMHTHLITRYSVAKSTNHSCESCGTKFETKLELLRHMKSQHGVRYFPYDECEFTTKNAQRLHTHLRVHNAEQRSKCDSNNLKFAHLLPTQIDEKPFQCNQCSYAFKIRSKLLVHYRTHTGEKPFKCNLCGSAFSVESGLRVHLRRHNGEKRFKCNQCNNAYVTNYSLQIHFRTHTGDKPYKCNICDYETTSSSNLNIHMSRHSDGTSYNCDACSYRSVTKSNLSRHVKNNH